MKPAKRSLERVPIMEFWAILGALKNEPRRGWIAKLGLKNPESVADHSYAVATICLYIAWSRGGYDLARLLKIALLHDLDEAFTGDLTPEDKQRLGRKAVAFRRRKAFEKILAELPLEGKKDYGGVWRDLAKVGSKEVRLVKDVDLIEMVLQAERYSIEGADQQMVDEFYDSALARIRDPELRLLTSKIVGRNRSPRRRLWRTRREL